MPVLEAEGLVVWGALAPGSSGGLVWASCRLASLPARLLTPSLPAWLCVQGEEVEEGQKSPGTAELLKEGLSDDEEEYQGGGGG